MKELRISLTEADFRELVAGKVIQKEGAKVCLQDIGWDRMVVAISDAATIDLP